MAFYEKFFSSEHLIWYVILRQANSFHDFYAFFDLDGVIWIISFILNASFWAITLSHFHVGICHRGLSKIIPEVADA